MTFLDSEVPALLGEPLDALLFTCVGVPEYALGGRRLTRRADREIRPVTPRVPESGPAAAARRTGSKVGGPRPLLVRSHPGGGSGRGRTTRLTTLPAIAPNAAPPMMSKGRCAPTYMRPNSTTAPSASAAINHRTDRCAATTTVSAAATAACPDG